MGRAEADWSAKMDEPTEQIEKTTDAPGTFAKTPVDEFMLSEYQTIASAHFDLHNGLRQSFRFYLGLVAVPFTLFAVYKVSDLDIFLLNTVFLVLFAVIPSLGIFMFLSMINTRFDIILYTRAVNGVRAYFKMRADQIGQADLLRYLKLPIDKNKPPYFEGSRAYTWLFATVGIMNSGYVLIFVKNLQNRGLPHIVEPWPSAILFFAIHLGMYGFFSWIRTRKEIPGVGSAI